MGAGGGPLSTLAAHDVAAGELTLARRGTRERRRGPFLDWLEHALAERDARARAAVRAGRRLGRLPRLRAQGRVRRAADAPLARSPTRQLLLRRPARRLRPPHRRGPRHLPVRPRRRAPRAAEWVDRTARRLRAAARTGAAPRPPHRGRPHDLRARARRRRTTSRDIAACQAHLRAGESYEICLTNELRGPRAAPTRSASTACCAASTRRPSRRSCASAGVEVLSSSPERFLALDRDGALEAKPIKGTAARGDAPDEDREPRRGGCADGAKDRAENLMIVDVLRNDLGRVAEIGSVDGADADGRRELRDRAPAGLDGARAAARRTRRSSTACAPRSPAAR